ncbi:MAG: PLP-dependent cysteine synthase family protein [Acidobacteriota bacterium]|nr:PLP-dependent cysteine synthase family protein [Acidobacteriota bacterium]
MTASASELEPPPQRPPRPTAGGLAAGGVLDLIGGTPLIDLSALVEGSEVRLLGKAEMMNPGGSVKDRPALAMVRDAEARGELDPRHPGRKRILDATSGNTGIALAMIGSALGYGVTVCLPANASPERKTLLAAYGAEVVLTDPLEGSDGAIVEARRRAAEEPDRYVYLDQYSNPANWRAHFETTGPEIWRQTGGALTHFVAGLGTTGTFTGVGRYLREKAATDRGAAPVRLIAIQPDGPFHGLEGMKHMESALVPAIYQPELADEDRSVSTEDAYAMVRRLARRHGLRLGISAGANLWAAARVAQEEADAGRSAVVVTVLCDGADKYLTEDFWSQS